MQSLLANIGIDWGASQRPSMTPLEITALLTEYGVKENIAERLTRSYLKSGRIGDYIFVQYPSASGSYKLIYQPEIYPI